MEKLTLTRLFLAVTSTALEELAIWVVWRWLLPQFGISLHTSVLIAIMVAWALFSIWLFIFTTRVLKKQVAVGLPSMVGAVGRVASRLAPEGMVKVRGELWGATSEEGTIEAGEAVEVIGERGLKLFVRRLKTGVPKR